MIRSAVRAAGVATCGVVVLGLVAAPAAQASSTTLSRDYGPVGTVVTITGAGVKDATDVIFGAGDAGAPTPVDDTHVQATVPSAATTGPVVVTAADGTTKLDAGTFTVQRPTSAVLTGSTAVVVFPHAVTLRAVLRSGGTAAAGQSARLQRSIPGTGVWRSIGVRKSTGSAGGVAWQVTPRRTYVYRVVFRASPSYLATTSSRVKVAVRPTITRSAPSVAPILTPFRVTGIVRPLEATGAVYLVRWSGGAWHRVRRASRTSAGHYAAATTLSSSGRSTFRLQRPVHSGLLRAQSAAVRVTGVNRTLHQGDSGSDVLALQRRLRGLHYDVGRVNGSFGYDTLHAVIAFQKVQSISRDGVVGPAVWRRLTAPRVPRLLHPFAKAAGVEVDLTHQVVLYGVAGHLRRIIDASTGGGYTYTSSDGSTHQAITPTGHFSVVYKRDGWVTAPLGTLYRPAYFNYDGYAIHGEGAVPSYPASHGCVRITVPAMDRFNSKLVVGLSVWIYRT
jgi:N-acetylmuramoyl-L-alanine amidase